MKCNIDCNVKCCSLLGLKPCDIGIVENISGCPLAKKRLYELGLNKGTRIEILKNDFGPLILNVSGFKLALGRSLADNVIVSG